MQDAPVECSIDATEAEQMACEAPKKPVKPSKPNDGGPTTQGGGGGGTNPPQPK